MRFLLILLTFLLFGFIGSEQIVNDKIYDANTELSADFSNRKLYNSSGIEVYNWETNTFVGEWTPNNDIDTISGILTINTDGGGDVQIYSDTGGYLVLNPSTGKVCFDPTCSFYADNGNSNLYVDYSVDAEDASISYSVESISNAESIDGLNAEATATISSIMPLNADANYEIEKDNAAMYLKETSNNYSTTLTKKTSDYKTDLTNMVKHQDDPMAIYLDGTINATHSALTYGGFTRYEQFWLRDWDTSGGAIYLSSTTAGNWSLYLDRDGATEVIRANIAGTIRTWSLGTASGWHSITVRSYSGQTQVWFDGGDLGTQAGGAFNEGKTIFFSDSAGNNKYKGYADEIIAQTGYYGADNYHNGGIGNYNYLTNFFRWHLDEGTGSIAYSTAPYAGSQLVFSAAPTWVTSTQAVNYVASDITLLESYNDDSELPAYGINSFGNANMVTDIKGYSVRLNDSQLNYPITVYAAGSVYGLTDSSALIDFGTTDPTITIDKAGTYSIRARVTANFNGATFGTNQTATLKLRRTNNTAADITSSDVDADTGVITTETSHFITIDLPEVVYTTTNSDDIISIYGLLSATPSAGSVDITEASIIAIKLY